MLGATVVTIGAAWFAAAGFARPAADDLRISVHLRGAGNTVNSLNFQIGVEVETSAGVEQTVVVRTALPPGLSWGADAPDPTEDCITANPAVCTTRLRANEVGTISLDWLWDVVAERPGKYEITASVTPTDSDPDLSNNTDTFKLEVTQPTTGGGGGGGSGGSGGGGTDVAASAVRLAPSKPKAGSTVVASVRVTKSGSPVRPIGVTCAASIGSAKVKGSPRAASGVASCLFKTPRSGKGKTLSGTIAFRAGGAAFTKRFVAKLS